MTERNHWGNRKMDKIRFNQQNLELSISEHFWKRKSIILALNIMNYWRKKELPYQNLFFTFNFAHFCSLWTKRRTLLDKPDYIGCPFLLKLKQYSSKKKCMRWNFYYGEQMSGCMIYIWTIILPQHVKAWATKNINWTCAFFPVPSVRK